MNKFQKAAALFPAGTRVRAIRDLRTGIGQNETVPHIPKGAHGIVWETSDGFVRVIFDTYIDGGNDGSANDGDKPIDITNEHYDRRNAFRQVFNFHGTATATEPATDYLATDDIAPIIDDSRHLTVVCEAIEGDGSLNLYSGPDTPEARDRIYDLDDKYGGMFNISDGTAVPCATVDELIDTLEWWGSGCTDEDEDDDTDEDDA